MTMRFSMGLLALAIASAAHASYDLVFAADDGTDSIHRFDGGTGTYLGSVGAGLLQDPSGVAIDRDTNTLFVTAANGIFLFNLWNGTLMNAEFTYGNKATRWAPGEFLFTQPSPANFLGGARTGISGWYNGANLPLPAQFTGIDVRGAGPGAQLILANATSNRVEVHSFTGFGGTTSALQFYYLPGGTFPVDVTSNQDSYMGVLADGRVFRGYYGTQPTTYGLNDLIAATAISYAHNDVFYAAGYNSSGSGTLQRGAFRMGGQNLGQFGQGILVNPRAVAVIAAPEPGTMIAVGAGLAALVSRRRRKR